MLWRSGVALARELDGLPLRGRRVVELGCGLGVPSIVAARAGADVLATDESAEALALAERNARENGVARRDGAMNWAQAGELVGRGRSTSRWPPMSLRARERGLDAVAPAEASSGDLGGRSWAAG